MEQPKIIGIDLGATNIRGAAVSHQTLSGIISRRIRHRGTKQEVLEDVFSIIDALIDDNIEGIGIGVPGLVDAGSGLVYNVIHIPSWKKVQLKKIMEDKYHIPVFLNNDANCFALGEHYFGKGKGVANMIGLTIGTGLGAGVIIGSHLYSGKNCGAGEFGMIDYLGHNYEFYCSGSFFYNAHGLKGEDVFEKAKTGDAEALALYLEMGTHLGNAIKMIMYAYDAELIVLGGSVRYAYSFFEKSMWERIQTFGFSGSIERLQIKISALENSGILGAAALCYQGKRI